MPLRGEDQPPKVGGANRSQQSAVRRERENHYRLPRLQVGNKSGDIDDRHVLHTTVNGDDSSEATNL